MIQKWYEMNAEDFDYSDTLGVLCVGSCEQHGNYLPVGTDGLIGWRLVEEAAEHSDGRVLLLPLQWVGYSSHHRAFPGYLTLSQDVMLHYLLELGSCVFEQGLEKLLIVNSHGGNQSCLQTLVNELGARYGNRSLLVRYWDLIEESVSDERVSQPGGMGHAGEFETSLMMYLYPKLVRGERFGTREAAEGNAYHHPDMFAKNKVYQYKPFEEYSPGGNVGQPQYASAQKGEQFFVGASRALTELMDYYHNHEF